MAKKTTALSEEEISLLHKFAIALERGHFTDYFETLQNTRQLLWKGFLTGLAKGFGAILGATVVVALVVALLSLLGDTLPGELGGFFSDTSRKIDTTVEQP